MKKISLLFAIVMLLGSFVISVSAEIDRSKFECIDDIIYLESRTTAGEIIEKSGDASVVVIDLNGDVLDADAYIPNGSYIATMHNGIVADKVLLCLKEDVNCDGKVNAADARLALRYSAKLETLSMIQQLAADLNNDNKITAADARLILRKPCKV